MKKRNRRGSKRPIVQYTLKVKPRRGKSVQIEVESHHTMAQVDQHLRMAFRYDTDDHCSAFFVGKPWRSEEIASINPGGSGENSSLEFGELGLAPGDQFHYVYDFGDNLEHTIEVGNVWGEVNLEL